MSAIEWTDVTWNSTTGCDRVSPGCDNCYALTAARRLKAMGQVKYQRDGDPRTSGPGFGITEHPDVLAEPLRWRKPRRVFVNSMSDLFHDGVSDEFIARVWVVMALTPQHTYQILTKRHGRMRSLLGSGERWTSLLVEAFDQSDDLLNGPMLPERWEQAREWVYGWERMVDQPREPLPNVHLGVSAEDQQWADIRVPALLRTPAAVRFVSAEPLLGPIRLAPTWRGLSWLIVGGESGHGARPLNPAWITDLIADCRALDVAPFVKQLGSAWANTAGWGGKGGLPEQWPAELRIREWPQAVTT